MAAFACAKKQQCADNSTPMNEQTSQPATLAAPDAAAAAPTQGHRTASPRRVVRHIPNLRSDDLRHPLDRQNTQLLSLLPGIENVVSSMLSPISEQVALLENIGTSVRVSEDQLPEIHALLQEAATLLQVDMPELYVRQDPVPNAYTLAIAGRKVRSPSAVDQSRADAPRLRRAPAHL